ncbi:MAG: ACT domain-containing protein [Acidobacteriota bacterium]
MTKRSAELQALLRSLEPMLHDGVYVYSTLPEGVDGATVEAIATVREPEGMSVIVPEAAALGAGLPVLYRAAWITLTVQSELQAVGLTAAFAAALGDAGISCNVVAGAYHDHLFVPFESGPAALACLRALQARATG